MALALLLWALGFLPSNTLSECFWCASYYTKYIFQKACQQLFTLIRFIVCKPHSCHFCQAGSLPTIRIRHDIWTVKLGLCCFGKHLRLNRIRTKICRVWCFYLDGFTRQRRSYAAKSTSMRMFITLCLENSNLLTTDNLA